MKAKYGLWQWLQQRGNAWQDFFRQEASSGIVLLVCALLAMAAANSPWGDGYAHWLHEMLFLGAGSWGMTMSRLHWVNDGLMTIFFLVVGLEIKREFLFGELRSPSAMLLPIAGAIGGMIVPAGIYALLNWGEATANGWGVPMATDIAFSLGVLTFAAKDAPRSLVVFLTALAIVDDLGGIVVIALFYSGRVEAAMLGAGLTVLLLLWFLGRQGRAPLWLYAFGGLAVWYAFLQSGIHPTIAGVLLGFSVPAAPTEEKSLLAMLEHRLTPWSAWLIMPVFALANAGIALPESGLAALVSPVGMGAFLGLLAGKPLGILLGVYAVVCSGAGRLPAGTGWCDFAGAGILGGIGFTMALFIASLAFPNAGDLMTAKMGIVAASVCSGLLGTGLFRLGARKSHS
jgi:Na+:H+ antiporter, NhaA family